MTEPIQITQKDKKPGLLRRILWWLWVILLSALFALSLFFAATWKVIALIVIFLAAATILPKVYRKWFWAGVGIILICIVVWIFLPEDNQGWRPYTFDKELAGLQAKYAIPDSENAAILYEKILSAIPDDDNEPEFLSSLILDLWKTNDNPQAAKWLQERQSLIDKTIEASKIDRCFFPITSDLVKFSNAVNRFGKMRRLAYLLAVSGNNEAVEGRMDEAVDRYLAILRLGRHLYQQPSLTEGFAGNAIESLAINHLNNIIITKEDTTERHLKKIENSIDDLDFNAVSAFQNGLEIDKLMMKNMFGLTCYQINKNGQSRLTRDPWAIVREMLKQNDINESEIEADAEKYIEWVYPSYWGKRLGRLYCIYIWFISPGGPEKVGEIIDKYYDKYYQRIDKDLPKQKDSGIAPFANKFIFSSMSINVEYCIKQCAETSALASKGVFRSYSQLKSRKNTCKIIIGLKRYKNSYGRWPQHLEDIKDYVSSETFIDPLNGDSYVYKCTDVNVILYSKGKNGIDEGGEHETKFSKGYRKIETIKDDVMIWPIGHKTSKQQEVNKDDEK